MAEKSIADGLPYTTLMYSTGPGYVEDSAAARRNLTHFRIGKLRYADITLLRVCLYYFEAAGF